MTISVIGGDERQKYIKQALINDGVCISEDISKTDAVIFPVPWSKDGENIYTQSGENLPVSDIIDAVPKNALLLSGGTNERLSEMCRKKGVKLFDYSKRDDFAILNTVPTAEAALAIAVTNVPHTIFKSSCCVLGYGKIGKHLASDLKALGAYVTVAARKSADLAMILTNGFTPLKISDTVSRASEFDIIFNTVPAPVIDEKILKKMKKDALIIELASYPYGTDLKAAEKTGQKVIIASGLPGKYSPQSAGEIIKNTVKNILKESEVWK